jgi:ABC-2 type transport system ATP-binding protein
MTGVEMADAQEKLIEVRDLQKTFKTGLFIRKTVEAVRGVSFAVNRGDIVGFLGPNGSGKTTTIKMLLGLIRPSAGSAKMFGESVPSQRARKRVGFLPENPYVYPYLTAREFIEMSGRLSGMSRKDVREATTRCLDRTGVLYAADRPVRKLSKGMLQRSALAAALVARPEMLVLDEPMSGLDPVGRKEVRDLIVEERDAGRTIFFATHILSDVETLCDHVIILKKGKVAVTGSMSELLGGDTLRTDVTITRASDDLVSALEQDGLSLVRNRDVVTVALTGEEAVSDILKRVLDDGAQVVAVEPQRETLEDLFMRRAL